jgi:hypothetical protein
MCQSSLIRCNSIGEFPGTCYRLNLQECPGFKDERRLFMTLCHLLAVWIQHPNILVIAIGDITADRMRAAGMNPSVIGDGSLEGTMMALNDYLTRERK